MSEREQHGRQLAYRVFSSEFNQATYRFQESDDDRAPVYVLLPTGAAANRVFIVGTLTETEDIGTDTEYWRGRIVDPLGTFFVYAGEYQPTVMEALKNAETPAFAAVTGKPRTYETEDGDINVSLRPEALTFVDEATRRRWVVETADQTLDRIQDFTRPDNAYADMAQEHYDVSIETFQDLTIRALESLDADDSRDT